MTDHTLNINTDIDDTDARRDLTRHLGGRTKMLTILVSLLLHIIIFGLVFTLNTHKHDPVIHNQDPVQVISAHLYFPPPIKLNAPEIPPNDVSVEQELTQIESSVEETTIEETTLEEVTIDEASVEEKGETVEPITASQDTLESTTISAADTPSESRSQRLSNALSSHLRSLEQQKMGELETTITRNRNQIMYEQSIERIALPKEPEPEFKTKAIDCSSTTGEIAGLLSSLAGGTLRCSDTPDFQKYIDARLNKTSENR